MSGDKEKIIDKLKQLTGHEHIKLTNSCNSAILLALIIAKNAGKDTILLPDQGGWLTYQTFPPLLGLKLKEVKTDSGLLDLMDLEKKADSFSALIINSLAGYIVPQPVKEIARICKSKDCLLIEDASGSVGQKGLCLGSHSDIIVASFGKWKPINLEYGGFISTNNKEYLKLDPELFQMTRFHEDFYPALLAKLEKLSQRTAFLQKTCQSIKSDLGDSDIIHPKSQGLNVIIRLGSSAEKERIINYCRNNKYEFTLCPRYIRVLDPAVSIEVKRLDTV